MEKEDVFGLAAVLAASDAASSSSTMMLGPLTTMMMKEARLMMMIAKHVCINKSQSIIINGTGKPRKCKEKR